MADYELKVRLLPCAHTAAEWASSTYKDKILKSGEIGYEKDTGRYKMGDGETKWASLPWASAEKLSSSAGSATQPIYFSGGKPVACTYSLNKTVPADAKFTDTNTWRGIQNNLTSTSTTESLSAAQGKILNEKFANYLTTSGTAVAAKKLANYYSARQESANLTTDGSGGVINFKATGSMKTGKPMTDGHILHFYWDNNGGWDAQFFIPAGDENNYAPQWRGMNGGAWQDWRTILDSGNYTSYTVKKDGTGASGTWGISITGNAKTATSATKATQDGNGSTITSTYLKLTGGTLTISSYYGLKIKRSDANGSAISYLNSNGAIGGAGFLSDGNFQISSGENTNGNIFKASTTAATFPGTVTATKFIGNLTGNADTAGKWSTARKIILTGSVTGSVSIDGSGDVSLATTTNHTHDTRYVYDKANVSGTMNDAATYRNAMGMISVSAPTSGTASYVNPNGQTGWHHFINMSYSETNSSNMWQTQIANKAGTTDLWVRSRAGGAVSDSAAWAAPWTRILTGSNWSNVITRAALGLGSIATYTAATTGTSDTWGKVPVIGGSDGVMEVGKYIDFHTTDGNTKDFDVRITADTTGLTISGTTSGTFKGNLTGNVTGNVSGSSGSCTGNAATATNADKLDGYHVSNVYNGFKHTIQNINTANTHVCIATITISGTSLSMAGFTAIFSNRECLDNSSFILTLALRRNSTAAGGTECEFYYTPIQGSAPREIFIRSDDGVTFKVYFTSVASSWTTYYNVTPLMTEGTVSFSSAGVTSSGILSGTVLKTSASIGGVVKSAATLTTARTINGTSFDGSANITTANWGTARTLTIGSTGKSVNGGGNVSWSLSEIGALPTTGGTMTGNLLFSNTGNTTNSWRGIKGTNGDNDFWYVRGSQSANNGGFLEIATSDDGSEPIYVRQYSGTADTLGTNIKCTLTLLDASGNSNFPGTVTASTFIGSLSGTATNAKFLANNTSYDYSNTGLSWFNADLSVGASVQANDAPVAGWWHMLRFNHSNSNAYYTDLAVPFNNNSLYYKCIRDGAVANNGWVKVLDTLNYSSSITNLTNGLTIKKSNTQNPLTLIGGISGNLESSISYTHPEISSSNNWTVGMGTGGTGYSYFGFWNNAYGNVMRLSNNGNAYVGNSIYFGWQVSSNDGKARLFSDSEGGNISLVSPNNIEYQIDTVNDIFRIYRWNGSSAVYVLSTTDASGHIYNAGSKVICARNFTLSGNTLYITTT